MKNVFGKATVLFVAVFLVFVSCASTGKADKNIQSSEKKEIVKAKRINPKKIKLQPVEWEDEEILSCELKNGGVSVPYFESGRTYSIKADPKKGKFLIVRSARENKFFSWDPIKIQDDGSLEKNITIYGDADKACLAYSNNQNRFENIYKELTVKSSPDSELSIDESKEIPVISISKPFFSNNIKLSTGKYYQFNIKTQYKYLYFAAKNGKDYIWKSFNKNNDNDNYISCFYQVPDKVSEVRLLLANDPNSNTTNLISFNVEEGESTEVNIGTEIVEKIDKDTVVYADPFRELYNLVYYLCDIEPDYFKQKDSEDYLRDAREYFANYQNHPLIQNIKNHSDFFTRNDRFYIDSNLLWFRANKNPNLDDTYLPYTKEYYDIYQLYLDFLDFAEDADFATFFNSHKDYYSNKIITEGKTVVESLNPWIKEFYKGKLKYKMTIYFHKGDWCDVNFNKENNNNFIINLSSDRGGDTTGLAHELSHPSLNDLVKKLYNSDLKSKFDAIYEANANTDAGINYPSGYKYLDDTMARACAGRALKKRVPSYYEGYLNSQKSIGFVLVPGIADFLEKYEKGNYKSIDDFYSELYKYFKSVL